NAELSFDLDQRARRYRAFIKVVAVPSQQRGDYPLPLLLLSAVCRSPDRFRECSATPTFPVYAGEYARATHFYPPCFVSDCCIERGVRHSRILNRVADHWDTQPQTTLHRSYRFGGVRLALWLVRVAAIDHQGRWSVGTPIEAQRCPAPNQWRHAV